MVTRPAYLLPVIIFSQFTGTSLWFAGNAVLGDLQIDWGLGEQAIGTITAAVQLGFICGTLVFALLAIADRHSPRWVFFWCCLLGATSNLLVLVTPPGLTSLVILRFATGFFLAGIYPVGMKIAASWFDQGLGRALGYLVGALVVGTAFPHLIRAAGTDLPWQWVMASVSLLTVVGASLMLGLVPDGPHLASASRFNPRALLIIFQSKSFRASVFGYFGHMWELYAFWAFVPVWLSAYGVISGNNLNIAFWSFMVIAVGFFGCSVGGVLSGKLGSARVAAIQLFVSGLCCLLSPFFFQAGIVSLMIFLLVWGITVVGDSPQLSTLNAENAPREYVGSALTIANSIGFLITVISIQVVNLTLPVIGPQYIFWLLLPGPLLGLWTLRPLLRRNS